MYLKGNKTKTIRFFNEMTSKCNVLQKTIRGGFIKLCTDFVTQILFRAMFYTIEIQQMSRCLQN